MQQYNFEQKAILAAKMGRTSDGDVTYQKKSADGMATVRLSKNFIENNLNNATHVVIAYLVEHELLAFKPTDESNVYGRKITLKGKGHTGVIHFKHEGFPEAPEKISLNNFEVDGEYFYKALSRN